MSRQESFGVAMSSEAWQPAGSENDPRSRLLASAIINGCYFHMEAYAMDPQASEQRLADPWFDDEYQGLCLLEPDGAFQTQEINGREYIIVLRPYCE